MAYEYVFITNRACQSEDLKATRECLAELKQVKEVKRDDLYLSYIFIENTREWQEDFALEIIDGSLFIYFYSANGVQMALIITTVQDCLAINNMLGLFEEL